MSILYLAGNRKSIQKSLVLTVILSMAFTALMAACLPGTVLAGGIGDVVTEVTHAYFASAEFDFGSEFITGHGISMHAGYGGYGNGYGGLTVLGPADATGMQAMLDYIDGQTNHTVIQTKRLKGCEVREYTMSDGCGVGVVLSDYFITVEFYQTGNSNAADIQTGIKIAQRALDGLEQAELLSQAAPNLENSSSSEEKPADEPGASTSGTALDEPAMVADTMNIYGVTNGPTAPTAFSVDRSHLVTYISTYHWNDARGAAGGTIALQGGDGKLYGPWQASTRPGQGGVPNAYWEVFPNIVIPAGTYTIIDSDPSTWSQNQQSEGRGMAEVKATPHFEEAGDVPGASAPGTSGHPSSGAWSPSPAGVGSVGNIPGPSNTTEAVVGVAVPGLIATVLGALAGLGGGGGGFVPPGGTPLSPTAGGSFPGTGGSAAGAGAQSSATIREAGQLGKRRRETDPVSVPGVISVSPGDDSRIDTAEMDLGVISVSPGDDSGINTAEMGQGVISVSSGEGFIIESANQAMAIRPNSGIIDDGDSGILIDTSALEDERPVGGEPGVEETGAAAETTGIAAESAYGQDGYNQAGFDKDGFNAEGFNKEGFDAEGFDKAGFNREGFNADGYDHEGFNKAGFDREGYGRNGFDKKGYDREGYDVNGCNQKGYNRSGYDAKGYNAQGYDKDGFDRAGYDREGYGRNGLNQEGYDRQGFDKDGYDREGFNYEGYNRSGYDPWGYDKQGYGKDGYHWSGYNADGYDRNGRHWLEGKEGSSFGKGGGSPFDVDTSGNGVYTVGDTNPFTEREIILGPGRHIDYEPSVSVDDSVLEKGPPLGQPYPKTVEKYGAKPWDDEIPAPQPEKPAIPKTEDTGIIGPEDPMNTIKNHGIDQDAPQVGQEEVSIPAVETGSPENSAAEAEGLPPAKEKPSLEYGTPGVPQDGEKRVLVGKTDGRSIEIEFDEKTGEWVNTENGNIVNPDRFEEWQNDLAEDRRRAAEDIEKMSQRQDAASQAIDQNLSDWKRLEQMQKVAEKYGIGEPVGPGDMDKAIQKLKDDMLAGKEINRDRMEQINKIIDNRIMGTTAADTGKRWEDIPWYKDLDSALKANLETSREVVAGEKADGSISWIGMGARVAIGAATGGSSEYIMTVTEAMHRINNSIHQGETGGRAVAKAIGQMILEEAGGELIGAAGGKAMQKFAETFPNLTQKAGDIAERIAVEAAAGDQIVSRKLGMISKQSAEEALADLAKKLDDAGAKGLRKVVDDKIADAGLKVASADDLAKAFGKGPAGGSDDLGKAVSRAASGSSDDIAGGTGKAADGPDLPGPKATGAADEAADAAGKSAPVDRPTRGARSDADVINDPRAIAKAEKSLQKNMDDFDKLPAGKKQELVREQAKYDEYRLQAEEKNWELADKVQRGEKLSVDDVLKLKSDPAAMRKLKEVQEIDGLGAELGDHGAKNVQMKYNETLNKNVYEPSYKDVQDSLRDKYGEVRVETVRTPGKEYHSWDVNTDNDIIATRKVIRNGKEEWVEIPRGEWEDTYFKSYAQNTGFDPQDAARKFPNEDWGKMSQAEQYRKWGELHGESPTDVYHHEAARDFSTQRTSILDGQSPDRAAAAQAARGEGSLLDAEGLGLMEKNKINHYWEKGDIKNQTEAMEQLRKASSQVRNLEQGYKNMDYKVADMPENMKKAIDAVNDNSLSPASRAARLAELGYDSPGDFVDKLTSRIGSLRAARK